MNKNLLTERPTHEASVKQLQFTRSRLALPRVFDNGVEIAPEYAPTVYFDLGKAVIQRNVLEETTEIAVGVMLAGSDHTFACLFLDVPSAKALAEKLLEVTAA